MVKGLETTSTNCSARKRKKSELGNVFLRVKRVKWLNRLFWEVGSVCYIGELGIG